MKKPIIRDEHSRYTSDRRYSVGLDNPEASWSQEKFDAMFCDFYDADDAPEMQLITVILFIPEDVGAPSSDSESGILDSSSAVEALPC